MVAAAVTGFTGNELVARYRIRPAGGGLCGPAARRFVGICGDLGPRGRFLRHGDSLSSCVVAGERADDVSSEWLPRQDSNLEPAG